LCKWNTLWVWWILLKAETLFTFSKFVSYSKLRLDLWSHIHREMKFIGFFSLLRLSLASKWTDHGDLDRANLTVVGCLEFEGLILWQNSRECHQCSWIRFARWNKPYHWIIEWRSRDKDGKKLPPFSATTNHTAWLDTRWPQRFIFTFDNVQAPPHNVSNGDFRRFYEHGEYLLKIHSDHKNLTIVAIKEDRLAYTAPAWGTFTALIALQIIYIFGRYFF